MCPAGGERLKAHSTTIVAPLAFSMAKGRVTFTTSNEASVAVAQEAPAVAHCNEA
jgi:hypothetical protein